MNNSLNLNNSKICQLELEERNFMNFNVTTYKKFKENIPNKKYDLILIDAPFGSDRFSRIDTLAIIPELLSDNFIIMLDDYERQGERDTGKLIFEKLNSFRVKYAHCIYKGAKETLVIASENLKFVCSMY